MLKKKSKTFVKGKKPHNTKLTHKQKRNTHTKTKIFHINNTKKHKLTQNFPKIFLKPTKKPQKNSTKSPLDLTITSKTSPRANRPPPKPQKLPMNRQKWKITRIFTTRS